MNHNQLFRKMELTSKRFESFKEAFNNFHGRLCEALAHKGNPISGVAIEAESIENGSFNVIFIGQRWKFAFSTKAEGGALLAGVVTVTRSGLDPDSPHVGVTSFTFDGSGHSDIKDPDADGDPVSMVDIAGSLYLAMTCINCGLS